MKKILAALIALASVNAFSQVIYLDTTSVVLGGNNATLIKTGSTPSNVTLRVSVPTTFERCNPGSYVTMTDGARCGYDEVPRYCRGGGVYRGGPVRRGPNYRPPRTGPNYRPPRSTPRRGVSIPAGRRYNPHRANTGVYVGTTICGYDSVPRTCSVCTSPYYETVNVEKSFDLTFSKFTRDATIEFSLDQYGNLILDVMGVAPGCVKKTVYGSGKNITGAKLKLKRSCR